jgi:DNA-binding GntR family transcriptional regulator
VDHDVPIRVDRSSPVPLYFQVAQHLEQLIESGELAAGSRLENEIDLADRLGLSRPTMRKAIG